AHEHRRPSRPPPAVHSARPGCVGRPRRVRRRAPHAPLHRPGGSRGAGRVRLPCSRGRRATGAGGGRREAGHPPVRGGSPGPARRPAHAPGGARVVGDHVVLPGRL
ncbi:MAG: hypothetical protein AVDCRST_MAG40-2309, partial [uncultured Gemmatimonadaceae bacterium]